MSSEQEGRTLQNPSKVAIAKHMVISTKPIVKAVIILATIAIVPYFLGGFVETVVGSPESSVFPEFYSQWVLGAISIGAPVLSIGLVYLWYDHARTRAMEAKNE